MYTLISLKNNLSLQVNWFKTQNECLTFVEHNDVKKYKIYQPNQKRNLTFLNAFVWSNEQNDFIIKIEIAKEIKKTLLREIRGILFSKLDTAFMKALEDNNEQKKQYIINLKNQFRDITNTDLPDDEQALIDFVPDVFKEVYDLNI